MKSYSDHPGYQKTLTIVKRFYYWSNLKRDVAEFVARRFDFQHVKAECKHLGGLLYLITILEWKWEVISMQFIIGFPRIVIQNDPIMVVMDRLTNVAHFILVKSAFSSRM